MRTISYSLVLALSVGLAACSDSGDDAALPGAGNPSVDAGADHDSETDADAGSDADTNTDPDVCKTANDVVDLCKDERDELLGAIDRVTDGEVKLLSEDGSTMTIYVDASAGGPPNAASNPCVYVKLGTGERVDLTDVEARSSLDWDLALKRATIVTNSGHWGPGVGGATFLPGAAFDAVGATEAESASIPQESLFDESCSPYVDGRGSPLTTFDGWYDYDPATHATPPKDGTFLVRAADCSLFKLRIESNTATPEGGTDGAATARYLLRVSPL